MKDALLAVYLPLIWCASSALDDWVDGTSSCEKKKKRLKIALKVSSSGTYLARECGRPSRSEKSVQRVRLTLTAHPKECLKLMGGCVCVNVDDIIQEAEHRLQDWQQEPTNVKL